MDECRGDRQVTDERNHPVEGMEAEQPLEQRARISGWPVPPRPPLMPGEVVQDCGFNSENGRDRDRQVGDSREHRQGYQLDGHADRTHPVEPDPAYRKEIPHPCIQRRYRGEEWLTTPVTP